MQVAAGEHTFTVPPLSHELRVRFGDVAELLGYDLEPTSPQAGEPVRVTLYWRALEGSGQANYTVFAHILAADGHLVGQHDGPPAGGTRPTTGWIPGEVISDSHEMTFREPYSGPAHVEVGLYDPVTMARVTTENGTGCVLLPGTINNEQ